MKKSVRKLVIIVLFLAGLSLVLYPLLASQWNSYRQGNLITAYDMIVAEETDAGKIDYEKEWEKARSYNEAHLSEIGYDSFAEAAASDEPDEEYMACLNLAGDGMMGYVEIPRINVKLPIYHTVKEEVLLKAAGHLEGSSLPVGGEGTHAVISAHRGLPSATLFTDLDVVEEGDHFLLYILDEVLCYEVDKISVVEPENIDDLAAEESMDYVTLLTCTPYGVNSHRLLVRGHRVPYESSVEEEGNSSTLLGTSLHTNYVLWVAVGLGVTGVFVLGLYLYDRYRRRKAKKE